LARRGPGEGSIYKHKASGRWVAELYLGVDEHGKKLTWRAYGEKRGDVKNALANAITDRSKNQLAIAAPRTVGDYLDFWVENVIRPNREHNTYLGYVNIIKNHLRPGLGAKRLDKLTAPEIQVFYVDRSAKVSAQMVLHIHRCLHVAIETATKWQLVGRNVADLVTVPRVPKREMRALSPDHARRFLEAIKGDPMQAYWVVALTTAMRPGEMLGLKWRDVDLADGQLRLQRAIARVRGAGWAEKDLKTHQGRNITLAPIAVESLREHERRQREWRAKVGRDWIDEDRVFCNEIGKPIEPQNLTTRSFKPILMRAGLPDIRPYDLRHSTASLLLSLGTHPKIVAELLGHGSVEITLNRYSHALPTLQKEAIRGLNDLLSGD
jgi:integrase